jgi:hypothetical protein
MLSGSHFLSERQALCNLAWISSMVSNRHSSSFSFIFGNRKKSQGAKSGEYSGWGMTAILHFSRNCWVRTEVCEMGCCHGEATRSVLSKVRGNVFAIFTQSLQNVAVEPGMHCLACWGLYLVEMAVCI